MYNEPDPKFMSFNYGPEYNLTAVTAPTVLFAGGRDVLAAPNVRGGGCIRAWEGSA